MFLRCPWLFPLYMCFSSLSMRQGRLAGTFIEHAFLDAHHEYSGVGACCCIACWLRLASSTSMSSQVVTTVSSPPLKSKPPLCCVKTRDVTACRRPDCETGIAQL